MIGSGILRPVMANQFKVVLGNTSLAPRQVTKLDINLVDTSVKLYIEQPIGHGQELIDEILSLCARGNLLNASSQERFPFAVHLMDGNDGVHINFAGFAYVVDHSFVLDYSVSEQATHVLTLKYIPSA